MLVVGYHSLVGECDDCLRGERRAREILSFQGCGSTVCGKDEKRQTQSGHIKRRRARKRERQLAFGYGHYWLEPTDWKGNGSFKRVDV